MSKKLINTGAVAAAVAVVAIGAYLLGSGQSSSTADTPNTPTTAAGQARPGFGPGRGMGTDVTGDTARNVENAVAAKYDGEVERVQKLSDGSYVAHVITNDGEIYVAVSKSFEVTGSHQRPQRGIPPGGAPQGSQSGAGGTTS